MLKEKIVQIAYSADHNIENSDWLAGKILQTFKEFIEGVPKPNPDVDVHTWRDYSPDMAYKAGVEAYEQAIFDAIDKQLEVEKCQ